LGERRATHTPPLRPTPPHTVPHPTIPSRNIPHYSNSATILFIPHCNCLSYILFDYPTFSIPFQSESVQVIQHTTIPHLIHCLTVQPIQLTSTGQSSPVVQRSAPQYDSNVPLNNRSGGIANLVCCNHPTLCDNTHIPPLPEGCNIPQHPIRTHIHRTYFRLYP
jgi:hypothetical protein